MIEIVEDIIFIQSKKDCDLVLRKNAGCYNWIDKNNNYSKDFYSCIDAQYFMKEKTEKTVLFNKQKH